MKVSGGMIGITLNPNARTKFFLISPEMVRLASEAQQMAGWASKARNEFHALSVTILQCHDSNVQILATALKLGFTNPFAVAIDDLFNLLTKSVMPENSKEDLCKQLKLDKNCLKHLLPKGLKTTLKIPGPQ